MSDPMALARMLAVVSYLSGTLAAARKNELGPEAAAAIPVGSRLPVMLAGRNAGFVSVPKPAARPVVADEPRFRAWVKANRPDEIVITEQVRDSFTSAVLASVKARGGLLDKEAGEVIPVPGVEIKQSDPSPRVELEDDAAELIGAAWRSGELDLGTLLALPPAEESIPGQAPSPEPDPVTAIITSHRRAPFSDEHGFLDPEKAAAHAIVVQGGYTTPPIEAYRMLADGGIGAERARAWLEGHGLDLDDPHRGKRTPWPLPAAGGAGGD